MSSLPLQRPRHYTWHRSISHDQRRLARHYFGAIDPERVRRANLEVGAASWLQPFGGIFGNLAAVLQHVPRHSARVLAFLGCWRGEIGKIKAEIEEIKRVRGGC